MRARLQRFFASRRPLGQSGYTLVVLAVAVSVMSVLVAAALPHWAHAMQREKEEELIFRGWQYAEAIRIFTQRTGRYPTSLKELMEVKPRSIRRLWKDPMSEDGNWGLIVQGLGPGQGNLGGGIGPRGQNGGDGNDLPGDDTGDGDGGGGNPGGGSGTGGGTGGTGGPGTPIGPITGVRSRAKGEATKTLFGKEKYSEWEFTVEALVSGGKAALGGAPVAPPGGRPGGPAQNPNPLPGLGGASTHPQLPKTQWIGRPFREGLQPGGGLTPPGGGIQNGGLPGSGFGGNRPPDSPPPVGDDDN